MNTGKKHFILNEVPHILAPLTQNQPAVWGVMTAQHMVEHLRTTFLVSQGQMQIPLMVEKEKLPGHRAWLMTNKLFPRNVNLSQKEEASLSPLQFQNLDEARKALEHELFAFYAHFEQHPQAEANHPVFGMLGFEAWEHFHYKHCHHHLIQFALMEDMLVVAGY